MRLRQFAVVGVALANVVLMVGTAWATVIPGSTLPGADGDLLLYKPVAATDFYEGYPAAGVTDGKVIGDHADYLSAVASRQAQFAIGGLNDALGTIRIWSQPDGTDPVTVASIKSSTSDTSLSLKPASYETALASNVPFTWTTQEVGGVRLEYCDVDVSQATVAGTKSLYIDLQGTVSSVFYCRVGEIQAYAPVPEPASMVLVSAGLLGLMAYAWRKRK